MSPIFGFNVVGLITNVQQSKLEIENLDHLIFIAKKLACRCLCWACLQPKNMIEFLTSNNIMIEEQKQAHGRQTIL